MRNSGEQMFTGNNETCMSTIPTITKEIADEADRLGEGKAKSPGKILQEAFHAARAKHKCALCRDAIMDEHYTPELYEKAYEDAANAVIMDFLKRVDALERETLLTLGVNENCKSFSLPRLGMWRLARKEAS